MALPRSLAVVTSLARSPRIKCVRRAKTKLRDSCDDKSKPPPCPPCESTPQPPCRGKVNTQQLAERIVCCSPPVGCRPPCATEEPVCSTNCSNVQTQEHKSATLAHPDPAIEDLSTCDANRDAVAKRLEIAETARRAAYLREVRDRKPEPKPEPVKYRLKGAAECVHATDGRSYGIEVSTPATARCGPCREAPPPCCVKLTADNECRPRGDTGVLDPCAHRPRTVISIDRSQRDADTAHEKPNPPNSTNPAPPALSLNSTLSDKPVSEGLTSRIMKSLMLNRTRDGTESKKTKQSMPIQKKPCTTTPGAPRWAGDTSWCASLKTPPRVPPRCRPPTAAERLRQRSARHDQRNHKPLFPRRDCSTPRRYLHTTTVHLDKEKKVQPKDIEASAKNLREMLKSRAALKEIARGRVVHGAEKCGGVNASGGLELPVPKGAAAVRVNVVVGSTRNTDTSENHKTSSASGVTVSPPRNPCTPLGKSSKLDKTPTSSSCSPDTRDSVKPNITTKSLNTDHGKWLSLKSLQKMVTTSRKKNESEPVLDKNKAEPCRPCGPRTPLPCPPPSGKPSNKPTKPPQMPPSHTKKSPCQSPVKSSNKPPPPPQNPKSPCERPMQPKNPHRPDTPSKN